MSTANPASAVTPERVDAVVLGAMDEEVAPFLQRAAQAQGTTPEELEFEDVGRARLWRLAIGAREILLARSGIGMVNAASAAVIALHRVAPAAILSTGSAGGLGGKVHVGDVAVGASATYSAADAQAFGYTLGQVPGMPAAYPGDTSLLEKAQAGGGTGAGGAAGAGGAKGTTDGTGTTDATDPRVYPTVVAGQVTTGDIFVDGERLDALRANFPEAAATDMESTAIAQVAHSFGVPFLTVRGISDLCGPDAGTEHPQTVEQVSEAAARVVLAAIG